MDEVVRQMRVLVKKSEVEVERVVGYNRKKIIAVRVLQVTAVDKEKTGQI